MTDSGVRLSSRLSALRLIEADLQLASDAVDEANGTSEYTVRLVAVALIARHLLREFGGQLDPLIAACEALEQQVEQLNAYCAALEQELSGVKAHAMPDGLKCRDLGECFAQHETVAALEQQLRETEKPHD